MTGPTARPPYFDRLRERLAGLSREDLEAAIVDHARRLDGLHRESFLAGFRPAEAEPAPTGDSYDPDLLDDIDAFVEDLTNYEYYQGYGWDPEIGDERAWGDESWVDVMDDLFHRAEIAFFAGDRDLGREAYGALLKAFRLDESDPVFCGPVDPEGMVETDVLEAKARYFRAVYETEPAEHRAVNLLHAIRSLAWVGSSEVGLRRMMDADEPPLPGFDRFRADWIEILERSRFEGRFAEQQRKWLLREAAGFEGLDGLADLARRLGAGDPEAYVEWIVGLFGEGRLEEALDAAREGVEAVPDEKDRARLADLRAGLAARLGREDELTTARRTAWRTDPTLPRLLVLCGPAGLDGLDDELDAARTGEYDCDPSLACRLELLTGAYEETVERLEAASVLGWSRLDHPGPVVYPFLLVAGSGRREPPAGSLMAELWEGLDPPSWSWPATETADQRLADEERGSTGESGPPSFAAILTEALERRPPGEEQRARFLMLARGVARVRVEAIVSGQHRGAYERAAVVLVACAEAHRLAGEEERGLELVRELREAFPRHSAFQREMKRAEARSASGSR